MSRNSWKEVEKIPEFVMEYTVSNLKMNVKYLFRLSAENEIGVDESIQMDMPITIRRYSKLIN